MSDVTGGRLQTRMENLSVKQETNSASSNPAGSSLEEIQEINHRVRQILYFPLRFFSPLPGPLGFSRPRAAPLQSPPAWGQCFPSWNLRLCCGLPLAMFLPTGDGTKAKGTWPSKAPTSPFRQHSGYLRIP